MADFAPRRVLAGCRVVDERHSAHGGFHSNGGPYRLLSGTTSLSSQIEPDRAGCRPQTRSGTHMNCARRPIRSEIAGRAKNAIRLDGERRSTLERQRPGKALCQIADVRGCFLRYGVFVCSNAGRDLHTMRSSRVSHERRLNNVGAGDDCQASIVDAMNRHAGVPSLIPAGDWGRARQVKFDNQEANVRLRDRCLIMRSFAGSNA